MACVLDDDILDSFQFKLRVDAPVFVPNAHSKLLNVAPVTIQDAASSVREEDRRAAEEECKILEGQHEEQEAEKKQKKEEKEAMTARAEDALEALKATPVKQVKVKQVCGCCEEAIGRKKCHETDCGHVFHTECFNVAIRRVGDMKGLCPTCQEPQPEPVKPVKKSGAPRGTYPANSPHVQGLTDDQEALMRGVYNGEYTLKWDPDYTKKEGSKCMDTYERAKGATTLEESKRLGFCHTEIARGYRRGYLTFFKDGVEAPSFK